MRDSPPVLTLDTSVLVAAFRPAEPAHTACRALLDRVLGGDERARMPATVLVELACAIARRTGDDAVAVDMADFLAAHAQFDFVAVDGALALDASRLGARMRLRGMDAVVVEVARAAGATLVTLDREIVDRCGAEIPAQVPQQAAP